MTTAQGTFFSGDPIAEAEDLMARNRPEEAARLLSERIAAGRGGVLARLALARALRQAGQAEEALALLRETSALAPGLAEVACAFGEHLLGLGHLPTAIAELQRALRL